MSRRLGLFLVVGGVLSCGQPLDSGTFGTLRFAARVKGTPPLSIFPPIRDRSGDIYTLYGAIGMPETATFVSAPGGGTVEVCNLTKGDAYGAHGWVGFSDDHAFYWSGDALVSVPSSGARCSAVLDIDPQTNSDLQFKAVMPFVRVTSTQITAVALVKTPTDVQPFSALVDLDRGIMTNTASLPGTGTVKVLGVGAERDGDARVTLIDRDGKMEADFFDDEANFTGRASVDGQRPPEYGIVGTIRMNAAGTWACLSSLGELLVFTRAGGGPVAFDGGVTPIGVHLWKDALWLVGTTGNKPVVVPLDDSGHPGQPVEWAASERAAAALTGALTLNDDRSFPIRQVTWTNVITAIGPHPFLSATSPFPHAPDTTVWVVAGPSDTEGTRPLTSIAIAPVGVTYP